MMIVLLSLFLVWMILPLFTGRDLNVGNASGLLPGTPALLFQLKPEWFTAIPMMVQYLLKGIALFYVLIVVIGVILMLTGCMKKAQDEKTVIVLGCRVYDEEPSRTLARRIKAAAVYLQKHPETVCIVSGGKGDDENISEAEAMYRTLVKLGIEAERIYKEDQSTTTYENFLYSRKIMVEHQLPMRTAVATSEFHQYRAALIARKLGIEAYSVPAPTPWWLLGTYVIREALAIPFEIRRLNKVK